MKLADIDITTLLLFLFAGNLTAAVFFAAYRIGAPDRTDAFDHTFLIGKLAQSAAWLLIGARGQLPDSLSLVGGNILLTLGVGAENYALISLTRISRKWWGIIFAAMALTASGLCLSLLASTDLSVPFALGSVTVSLFFAVTGWVFLFLPANFSWLTMMMGLSYAACSAGCLFRAWRIAGLNVPFNLFDQAFSQVLALTLMSLVMSIGNLGYILVKKDGVDRRLFHLATRDPLTGVFNRAAFREEALRFWSLARREDRSLSLLMTDLDHFKEVNDNYGHPAGDEVLQKVVKIMQDCLRPYDVVGRYGGEEFILLLPGTTDAEAKSVAERIRERMDIAFMEHDPPYGCTISIGLASCRPARDMLELQDLIRSSDIALYAAKDLGRNRVVLSSDIVPAISAGELDPNAAPVGKA